MCYIPLGFGHPYFLSPLYPNQDSPARVPCLQKNCPRVHLSLIILPPLHLFFVYLSSHPVAPVVTRRLPVRLTGGRCHAAPGGLSSVSMFGCLTPTTCGDGGTSLGCGWRGVGERFPPNDLEVFNAFRHTDRNHRSIFGALDSPRSSWCLSLSAPPPSPFPRTNILVLIPSLPTGEYFCGRPTRPLPVGSPCPRTRRPPKSCQDPVPCPPYLLRCHARSPVVP